MIKNAFAIIVGIVFITSISCTNKKAKIGEIDLTKIPSITPRTLTSFDKVDSLYFSHLGYLSLATSSGDILISDRELPTILLLTPDMKIKKSIGEGRGPGEILDAHEFNEDKIGNIFINDQGNKKILIFDSNLDLIREVNPKLFEGAVVSAYPMGDNNLLFELTSFGFLQNKNETRKKSFVQYNFETEEYGKQLILEDRPFSRDYLDERLVGATPVPFSFNQLTVQNPRNESILTFDTRTSIIAELDFNFDTVRVIPVSLPKEALNNTEKDSIRKDVSKDKAVDRWKTMKSMLPEFKSVAENMLLNNGKIWLQSNLRGKYQKWFVLNMKGQIIKVVHLPKDGMVTHVSDENIGVRLNDTEFSLFKNQKN